MRAYQSVLGIKISKQNNDDIDMKTRLEGVRWGILNLKFKLVLLYKI